MNISSTTSLLPYPDVPATLGSQASPAAEPVEWLVCAILIYGDGPGRARQRAYIDYPCVMSYYFAGSGYYFSDQELAEDFAKEPEVCRVA